MRFSYTPKGVACLFLKTFKSDATNEEAELLGGVIEDAWRQGIYVALDKAKESYRKRHSGGCRMSSRGDVCPCFLCEMDNCRSMIEKKEAGE